MFLVRRILKGLVEVRMCIEVYTFSRLLFWTLLNYESIFPEWMKHMIHEWRVNYWVNEQIVCFLINEETNGQQQVNLVFPIKRLENLGSKQIRFFARLLFING